MQGDPPVDEPHGERKEKTLTSGAGLCTVGHSTQVTKSLGYTQDLNQFVNHEVS